MPTPTAPTPSGLHTSRNPSQSLITREIRRRILTGQWGSGQRIPPERQLEKEFGCSRLTVARALVPLVADGMIERFRGRGSFVAKRGGGRAAAGLERRGRRLATTRGNVVKYISPGQVPGVQSSRDDVLAGLHEVLDAAGYHVSIDFYSDLAEHLNCLAKADDLQIAGLVVWPSPDERTVEAVRRLVGSGVPVVLIDTYLPELDCDYVVTDNITGAATMVHFLAELGHRQIGYVMPDERRTSLVDRVSGFLRGMVETGLPIDSTTVLRLPARATADRDALRRHAGEALERFLAQSPRPTALFASHDSLAIMLQGLLRERGLRVPEDLTVVGYDGIEAGEFCAVPLTTVKQDFLQAAQVAARILLERFSGRSAGLRFQSLVPPQLVKRQSAAPAPQALGV